MNGFFDLQHSYLLSNSKAHQVEFGQFEIGLSKKIGDNLNFEGAIAYNAETGNFEIGSGFADFTILNFDNNNWYTPSNLSLMVGQFDVPFGIDYKCIASPDRDMVSRPLAIQNSIGCLNSLGAEIHGSSELYNFNLYLINDFLSTISYGARIGIAPIQETEIGYSFLSNISSNLTRIPNISGIDLRSSYLSFEVKGEYIWGEGLYREELIQPGTNSDFSGYYFQMLHHFDLPFDIPIKAGIRYGNWYDNYSFSNSQGININRISAILSLAIMTNTVVKVEYGTNILHANLINQIIYTQLVLSF
ncbi:MAG: hypothetical protein OQJ81_04485 [Melioribacteraceae bacterium]|nr:hypothetical protein [Melioribacteraceae bacterium]